jgi:G3E family GTPase
VTPRLWDGRRAPFTLLGGYLGAGKTTIVNHVVRHAGGRRLVVLVNDVGTVNVDATLIADHDGTTLTLTNGCVCCAIADDFAVTLERLRGWPEPPDHVLMELSGVAEPARVAPWADTTGFRLDGVVVAVDAEQVVQLAGRPYVGGTILEQLRSADVVLLTKTDLAADGGAAARDLVGCHTSAPVLVATDGRVDVEVVLGLGAADRGAPLVVAGEHRDVDAYATSVLDPGRPTRAELDELVRALPADVIRAKGLVDCSDDDAPVEVHVVGTRRTLRRRRDLPAGRATGIVVVAVRSPPSGRRRDQGRGGTSTMTSSSGLRSRSGTFDPGSG